MRVRVRVRVTVRVRVRVWVRVRVRVRVIGEHPRPYVDARRQLARRARDAFRVRVALPVDETAEHLG